VLDELGKSRDILVPFLDNPALTQAEAAQMLGLSRQTVGYHLNKLAEAGIIKRNGHGVEVLVEFAPVPQQQRAAGAEEEER